MSTKAERAAAAAVLGKKGGRKGKGAAKRRGDAAHYAALRVKREGTVTVEDMRGTAVLLKEVARSLLTPDLSDRYKRVAVWLDREADRRQRINEERARERSKGR